MDRNIVLSDLKSGESVSIVKIIGTTGQRTRLLQMGFTPKTSITIIRDSPLFELKVRDTLMILRPDECKNIIVKRKE